MATKLNKYYYYYYYYMPTTIPCGVENVPRYYGLKLSCF